MRVCSRVERRGGRSVPLTIFPMFFCYKVIKWFKIRSTFNIFSIATLDMKITAGRRGWMILKVLFE